MTPNEMVEIFAAANAAREIVKSKPTYADVDKFDEIVNELLVELIREHDEDECRM